ncbi:hypothetical protein [Neobacillus terrae]|nr:hypothetical protein [Neobacillus terrae]
MEQIKSFFILYPKTARIVALILLAYLFMESIQAGYKTGMSLFG